MKLKQTNRFFAVDSDEQKFEIEEFTEVRVSLGGPYDWSTTYVLADHSSPLTKVSDNEFEIVSNGKRVYVR
jgi:hypothetical protein